jgi:hypothetical protein
MSFRHPIRRLTLGLVAGLALHASAAAQDQRDEQFYYPGSFNWKFLKNYPEGARLFNAFDYGHAVLYEKLCTTQDGLTVRSLEKEYRYLTTDLLVRPPRLAIAEEAVMPRYAKLAWRAKQMFDWAHVLHRQIYDIYSDHALTRAQQDSLIEQATDYYLSREEYAFLPVPKSMALMDEQYYSRAFRKAYPKFNGLIWAYHWLQVGLYEPFIEARTVDETKAGVQATLARFWSMLRSPANGFPKVMPMASGVAPRFSAAHPRAAVIFDNLHMMHDIISDILHNDTVPAGRKREVIYAALDEFQDSTANLMSMDMWRSMADHMGGLAAMGGPAIGGLPATARETGKRGHEHGATPSVQDPRHRSVTPGDTAAGTDAERARVRGLEELHQRLMQDSVIRRRIMEDGEMLQMMQLMVPDIAPADRDEMQGSSNRSPGAGKPKRPRNPQAPAPWRENPVQPADSSAHRDHLQRSEPQL